MTESVLPERIGLLEQRIAEEWAGRNGGGAAPKQEALRQWGELYMRELQKYPRYRHYKFVSPEVMALTAEITAQGGSGMLEVCHRLVLARLMREALEKDGLRAFPADIADIFLKNFERIASRLEAGQYKEGYYLYEEDKFNKDLSICRLSMIPLGAQKVYAGRMSRGLLFRGGIRQFWMALKMILTGTRGFCPIYRMHTDSRDRHLMSEFNPEGWLRFYRRAAELLECNPKVKGVCGTSWFWDPALKEVSPELAYLRETALACGGQVFRQGESGGAVKDALFMSRKRQELYQEGKYRPESFAMVLPRSSLLRWARRDKRERERRES